MKARSQQLLEAYLGAIGLRLAVPGDDGWYVTLPAHIEAPPNGRLVFVSEERRNTNERRQ